MNAASPLRVAVAGCGRIARLIHLPLLRQTADLSLVAVAEADPAQRPEWPGVATVGDAQELMVPAFIERHGLEAVFVCVPPAAHGALAVAALDAGLHVYVEKPLAESEDAAAAMLAAARRNPHQVAAVGFNYRFDPSLIALENGLREGRLGDLRLARTLFSSARRAQPAWKERSATGGGVLPDLGSHHLDLLPALLGRRVRTVAAWPDGAGADLQSDDTAKDAVAESRAHVTLELEGEVRAECDFLFGAADQDRWEVHGELGFATVDRMHARLRWTPSDHRGSKLRRVIQGGAAWGRDLAALARLREGSQGWGSPHASYREAFAAFAAAVRGEAAPRLARFEDGWHSLVRVEAARQSMRHGIPVEPASLPALDRDIVAGCSEGGR